MNANGLAVLLRVHRRHRCRFFRRHRAMKIFLHHFWSGVSHPPRPHSIRLGQMPPRSFHEQDRTEFGKNCLSICRCWILDSHACEPLGRSVYTQPARHFRTFSHHLNACARASSALAAAVAAHSLPTTQHETPLSTKRRRRRRRMDQPASQSCMPCSILNSLFFPTYQVCPHVGKWVPRTVLHDCLSSFLPLLIIIWISSTS